MKRQKNRLKIASSSLCSDFAITDWSKCCLCQKDSGGETVCSAKNPIKKKIPDILHLQKHLKNYAPTTMCCHLALV